MDALKLAGRWLTYTNGVGNMIDSERVMELATAVSEANARLDAVDDMQKQAYHDACVAEEALLDYLGSVVTKVARDAEDDFDQPSEDPEIESPDDETYGANANSAAFCEESKEAEPVINANGADLDSPVIGSFSEVSDEDVRAAGGEPETKSAYDRRMNKPAYDFGPAEDTENPI